ncbi:MAG: hypothetical protein A3E87_06970 [Gammaproteobacteria bacterium RIFCSPHIGHO2_12_FULL_35_23]|nr:MAG: hypothetical protein A3E87_06970 [Gammaproteobacteria bacterium RIFCSPHIGHO2_12_FULL_35_23]
MLLVITLVIAYLLGSINCAIIVCKLANLPDPRTQGSNNPGASNILRTAGKTYALLTFLGDGLKGFIAVFIGLILGVHGMMLSIVGLVAVLGHMYPLFFRFQGGKGVATALGSYFALSFPLGIISLVIWFALAAIFRYASLASLVTCIITPIICLFFQPAYFVGLVLMALIIIWRHRSNIERLRSGNEAKIVFNKPE